MRTKFTQLATDVPKLGHDRPGAISRPHGAFPVVSEGHDSCRRFQELTVAGARAVSGGDERQESGGHAEGAVALGAEFSHLD